MSGRDRLLRLLSDLEENNVEGTPFISERGVLDKFNEGLLDEVLDELYHHAPPESGLARKSYHQRIFKNCRLCLAILIKIGRSEFIFRFCESPRFGDDKLPISKDILLDIADLDRSEKQIFATVFYRNQFMFKPVTFDKTMGGVYTVLPPEIVVPIIRKKALKDGEGGWSIVYEIEIHSDYDKLGHSPQDGEISHVYACKELRISDELGEEEAAFRREINIQYALQGLSPNILPLLTAYKHNDKYRMIFPQADCSLRQLMREEDKQPKTPDDQWAFLTQVQGIVDAIYAIHDYKDKDAKAEVCIIKSQDQSKTIGSHRDLSPQNILLKGGRLLLADFGEAQVQSIKPGEDTGSEWVWGPSTYRAPECVRNQKVGRGGDIWSLACIISEILTFILLGSEGCRTYSDTRNVDRRDIFHDNFNIKEEVIKWFEKLEQVSGQSKAVVDILKLLLKMLEQNPKSRPPISTVKKQLSEILQHQGPLCTTYCDDNGVNVLDQLAPRTSKDRHYILSKLSIPFTYTSFTAPWPWPWSPAPIEPPTQKAEVNAIQTGDSQIPRHPQRTQSQPMTSRPSPPKLTSQSSEFASERGSMTPQTPLKDNLDGPLLALRGYDTVFLVDDSKIDEHHWVQMGQVLINLASVATQLDPDGIDLCFLESVHCEVNDIKTWKEVADTFSAVQPCTKRLVLGDRVSNILESYIRTQPRIEETPRHGRLPKPKTQLNLIVLTDGQLDEDDNISEVIEHCVKLLDGLRAFSGSIGVQFVLFGSRDLPRSNLFKFLDDEVASEIGSLRDIVDTTEFNLKMLEDPKAFKKILCGAINKKLDGSGRPVRANRSSSNTGDYFTSHPAM